MRLLFLLMIIGLASGQESTYADPGTTISSPETTTTLPTTESTSDAITSGTTTPTHADSDTDQDSMKTMTICENHQETLRCPVGYFVDIQSAYFGRDNAWTCVPVNTTQDDTCEATEVVEVLKKNFCQRYQQECTIVAQRSQFLGDGLRDNCRAGEHDSYYLRADFKCKVIPDPAVLPLCTKELEGYIPGGKLLRRGVPKGECKTLCESLASCIAASYFPEDGSCYMHCTETACKDLILRHGAVHYQRLACNDTIPSSFESASIGSRSYGGVKIAKTCVQDCLRKCETLRDCYAAGYDLSTGECWIYTNPIKACSFTYDSSHWAHYKRKDCPRITSYPIYARYIPPWQRKPWEQDTTTPRTTSVPSTTTGSTAASEGTEVTNPTTKETTPDPWINNNNDKIDIIVKKLLEKLLHPW